MLRLSKKVLFAIEAVVDISYHARWNLVRSNEISQRQGIPRRYLEQVLQTLVHEGVLQAQRGPKGGYSLAIDSKSITIGQLIRIVRKLEGTGDPLAETEGSEIGQKVLRPLLKQTQQQLMAHFDRLTVFDLCQTAEEEGIERESVSSIEILHPTMDRHLDERLAS